MRNDLNRHGLSTVCRFCLHSECVNTIFDHDTIDIVSVVKFITQLEISSDDAHTKFICEGCRKFLETVAEFRERCIQSYNTLRSQQQLETNLPIECIKENKDALIAENFRLEFIECESPSSEVLPGIGANEDEVEHLGNETICTSDAIENEDQLQIETKARELNTNDNNVLQGKLMQDSLLDQETPSKTVCPLCGEHFTGGKIMVKHHIKSDHGDDEALPKIRQCFFCPKAYSSYQLLKYHLNFHPQKVWQCPQCDKRIEKKGLFIDHLRIHANERHYECKVCGKRFTTIKYLSTHRQLHKPSEAQENAISTDVLIKNPSATLANTELDLCRKNDGEQEQNFQCNICPQVFHLQALLNVHMQSDHVQQDDSVTRSFRCKVCTKTYASMHHLNIHMQQHAMDSSLSCTKCLMKFNSKSELMEHQKSHNQRHSFLCIHCGKEFPTSRYLNRHLQTHAKENKRLPEIYECEICGKQMKFKSNYTNHRKTHKNTSGMQEDTATHSSSAVVESKKVYLCNICGHDCGSSSNLTVHLRRHNGQSICQCSVCGKGYPRKSDLVMHMRTHTGEKPFKCKSCGRGFSRRDKLRIHTRTHTGEKPYDCPCGRAYVQKNDLKKHQKRNICGQNFDMSALLAPYPASICIKSPSRPRTPPRAIGQPQPKHHTPSGTLVHQTPPVVAKDPAELMVAADAVVDMVETTSWGHFMTDEFPKPNSTTDVHYGDVSFSSQPKLYS